jgi:Tfp pilus assembly protein PilF
MITIPMPRRLPLLIIVAFALASVSCSPLIVQQTPAARGNASGASASRPSRADATLVFRKAASGNGEQQLERGIRRYEEGAYKNAARQFQAALDLGLDGKPDRVTAHKYLAFIACASGREKSCRDEFRKALHVDADFDLTPAEAGHPVWGAAFRSVKIDDAAKGKWNW